MDIGSSRNSFRNNQFVLSLSKSRLSQFPEKTPSLVQLFLPVWDWENLTGLSEFLELNSSFLTRNQPLSFWSLAILSSLLPIWSCLLETGTHWTPAYLPVGTGEQFVLRNLGTTRRKYIEFSGRPLYRLLESVFLFRYYGAFQGGWVHEALRRESCHSMQIIPPAL